MNYYNPYFYTIPNPSKIGLFKRIFGEVSLGSILSGTERAINLANQAIPLIKQVKPVLSNAKTMFKVMNEFKKNEKPNIKGNNNYNGPTFYA